MEDNKQAVVASHRRAVQTASLIAVLVIGVGSLTAWGLFSTQRQPQFYRLALETPIEQSRVDGDQFEATIIDLANQMRRSGKWQAALTQEQINGWIASDLPEKFPNILPANITDPRVSIEESCVQIAFQFKTAAWSGVGTIQGEVFCTQRPNQIAIRIIDIRSGIVSIPLGLWTEPVQQSLAASGVLFSWADVDGDPVALIDLPPGLTRKSGQRVVVQSIWLEDGKLMLAGSTVATAANGTTTSQAESVVQPSDASHQR